MSNAIYSWWFHRVFIVSIDENTPFFFTVIFASKSKNTPKTTTQDLKQIFITKQIFFFNQMTKNKNNPKSRCLLEGRKCSDNTSHINTKWDVYRNSELMPKGLFICRTHLTYVYNERSSKGKPTLQKVQFQMVNQKWMIRINDDVIIEDQSQQSSSPEQTLFKKSVVSPENSTSSSLASSIQSTSSNSLSSNSSASLPSSSTNLPSSSSNTSKQSTHSEDEMELEQQKPQNSTTNGTSQSNNMTVMNDFKSLSIENTLQKKSSSSTPSSTIASKLPSKLFSKLSPKPPSKPPSKSLSKIQIIEYANYLESDTKPTHKTCVCDKCPIDNYMCDGDVIKFTMSATVILNKKELTPPVMLCKEHVLNIRLNAILCDKNVTIIRIIAIGDNYKLLFNEDVYESLRESNDHSVPSISNVNLVPKKSSRSSKSTTKIDFPLPPPINHNELPPLQLPPNVKHDVKSNVQKQRTKHLSIRNPMFNEPLRTSPKYHPNEVTKVCQSGIVIDLCSPERNDAHKELKAPPMRTVRLKEPFCTVTDLWHKRLKKIDKPKHVPEFDENGWMIDKQIEVLFRLFCMKLNLDLSKFHVGVGTFDRVLNNIGSERNTRRYKYFIEFICEEGHFSCLILIKKYVFYSILFQCETHFNTHIMVVFMFVCILVCVCVFVHHFVQHCQFKERLYG